MSPLEIAGALLGVLGVWLMIRQHVLAWPVGMVQVSIYAWIFQEARLYSDALLQAVFFVVLGYGGWRWWRGRRVGGEREELPVTRLTPASRAAYVGAGLAGTLVWGEFMRRATNADLPHWDAFVLVFGLISQWLQAHKKLENWMGWTAVNAVAIGIYCVKDLWLTAGLYGVFLIMGLSGWRVWNRRVAA